LIAVENQFKYLFPTAERKELLSASPDGG